MGSSDPQAGAVDDRTTQEAVSELEMPGDLPRDGIGENDNPIPLWFNVGFYGLIVYGILYILYYVFSGWSQASQYDAEVARFLERYPPVEVEMMAANPFRGDKQAISDGQEVFTTICAACHKPDGTGLVGPSLVDPYWKYGSGDPELYESVANGRPAGMPGWVAQIGQDKVWKVLAYVETLPKKSEPGVGAPAAGGGT